MRASISAALDGELSEFESVSLQTHLDGCDSCRAFEASAQFSTTALRTASLEQLSRPLILPSRRRITVPLRVPTAAAAAAVLMIVFGGVFESLHGGAAIRGTRPSSAVPGTSAAALDNGLDVQAMVRRQQQANLEQLVVRRAQFQSNRMARHPGFQNPWSVTIFPAPRRISWVSMAMPSLITSYVWSLDHADRVSAMLKAYEEANLPNRPGPFRRAWLRYRAKPTGRVETAEPAKPPRPPVGIASDAEGVR